MISKDDTIAFDECSILHWCEIKIPNSFKMFFDKEKLVHRNFSKLNQLINKLDFEGINKYKFDPSDFESNIIKVANEYLSKEGNQVTILGVTLKVQILDQLNDFIEKKIADFKSINKNDDIGAVKQVFLDNEKELTKKGNIPEDDDLKIISGFDKFISSGRKFLISEDEHFWGYDDLIEENFNINVIKEWECYKIS